MDNLISDQSIEIIAQKLGIAVDQVFQIYTSSTRGMAVIDMYVAAIVILLTLISYAVTYKYLVDDRQGESILLWLFVNIMIGVIILMVMTGLATPIKHYYFPEYYAIQDMLSAFGR